MVLEVRLIVRMIVYLGFGFNVIDVHVHVLLEKFGSNLLFLQ